MTRSVPSVAYRDHVNALSGGPLAKGLANHAVIILCDFGEDLLLSTITKLGIGLTSNSGSYKAKTTGCLLAATVEILRFCVQQQGFLDIEPILGEGPYPHMDRQMVVDMAFKRNCSHLLFVDGDMLFSSESFLRLMAHDLDIVGAKYNKRTNGEDTVPGCCHILAPVPFVPTGFLLVAMSVFEKIGTPAFSMQGDETTSEDVYFCDKAISHGYKVWCDPTIKVGHLYEGVR